MVRRTEEVRAVSDDEIRKSCEGAQSPTDVERLLDKARQRTPQ